MLSTMISERIELDITLEGARDLCNRIVSEFGWNLVGQDESSYRIKEDEVAADSFIWPAEVEIKLSSGDQGKTCISLKGKSFGSGAKQKGHIEGHLWNIRNRIESMIDH